MSNKKGFTLIELMAVIVIILVIVAITIPKVTEVLDQQNKKTDIIYIKKIVKDIDSYMNEELVSKDEIGVFNDVVTKSGLSKQTDDKGDYIITSISKLGMDIKEFEYIDIKLYSNLDYSIYSKHKDHVNCANASGDVYEGECESTPAPAID